MSLLQLPNELLCHIAECLQFERDIAALANQQPIVQSNNIASVPVQRKIFRKYCPDLGRGSRIRCNGDQSIERYRHQQQQ